MSLLWSQDRATLRRVFYVAWQHFRTQTPLKGIETLIVNALIAHPEYQPLFEGPENDLIYADSTEHNPFFHLGLHIALAEQLSVDRPAGIQHHFARISQQIGDAHHAEHLIIACLEEVLWESQHNGTLPDEQAYLACLARLPSHFSHKK